MLTSRYNSLPTSLDARGLVPPASATAMENIFDGKPGKGKNGCDGSGSEFVQPGEKDTQVQLVISLALGSTAFLAFCVSRKEIRSVWLCDGRK